MADFKKTGLATGCAILIALGISVAKATPKVLTYQGRILKVDGSPLEFNSVSFIFQLLDISQQCVLFEEQLDGQNMVGSHGMFDLVVGNGTRVFPVSLSFSIMDAFSNSGTLSCKQGGLTVTPGINDSRYLRVSFHDGQSWKVISPDIQIRSVPYAAHSQTAESAQKLGNNIAADFLTFAGLPTCGAGQFLTYDGTALTCAVLSGGGGGGGSGTVTSVSSANTDISILTGTSTPVLTLNSGTAANQIVKLDGTAKLPAVDGSQLTNFTAMQIPSLDAAKITTGSLAVSRGGTGQSTYADGEILIGNTATTGLTKATLTAGSGVSITNGNGSITIAATGGTGTVTSVSGTSPINVATGTSTPVISLANGSAAGQVYRWDGTSAWAATKLKYTDLVNSTAVSPWPSTSCVAGEAITWSSVSDSFACTSLSIAASQLTGTIDAARMPALTGDTTMTAGTTTTTTSKVNGVSYPASPATNTVPVVTAANTITYQTIPVAAGGTGATSLGSGNLLVGAGTGAVTSLAAGSAGNLVYATGISSWASGSADTAGLVDKASTQTISGAKAFTNSVQLSQQNELRLADADSTNYVALRSPATVSANVLLTLPATAGSNGQALTTDGSGNLTWTTIAGGGGSQWSAVSGIPSDIYYNSGKVGIGTPTPSATLEISGASGSTLKIVDGNQQGGKVLTSDAAGQAMWAAAPVAGFAGAVDITSSSYTITSSQNGIYFTYNGTAAGVITLPVLSGVSAGFQITIARQVALALSVAVNGADLFDNGLSSIELQGQNIKSITITKLGSKWTVTNQTADCIVGQSCWGTNNIYVGVYNGHQYFTTPGNCVAGSPYTCNGQTDTTTKAWATAAPESTTNIGMSNYIDGKAQTVTLAGYATAQAAQFCNNINSTGGYAGYTDWYLPANKELSFLYQQSQNISGFVYSSYYWSSTEYTAATAWSFKFTNGYSINDVKSSAYYVRCVRRF